LYLARSAEALDIEEAMQASDAPSQNQPPVSPEIESRWENFISVTKALTPEQKHELNTFWEVHSSGRPKPTKSTATIEDIDALVVKAMSLAFGATLVEEDE